MEVENLIIDRVATGFKGDVVKIIANYEGKGILFTIQDGKLKRRSTPDIPFFTIPEKEFSPIRKQIYGIIKSREKTAELARQLKKPNWAFELEKCGIIIMEDGRLTIPRWIIKDRIRERIWQTLKDVNSAIRQQDHIIEKYLEQKNYMVDDSGSEISGELSNLLKKLKVVQPVIEMRRLFLMRAQGQMDLSIQRTIRGLELLLKAEGDDDQQKCHRLPEKLKRLAFFLDNNWPKPYQEKIERLMPLIKEAKKSAANLKWDKTKTLLLNAKEILSSTIENCREQSQLISISEINPIKLLTEVDKRGLTNEVMAVAKKHLPDQYLKYQGWFRLNVLLAVSELMIEKKAINQEEIFKLCR